jgi:hypothetical protein
MVRNGLSSRPALVPGPDTDSGRGRCSARPDHHCCRAGRGRQLILAAYVFPGRSQLRKMDLLVLDALGYVPASQVGAELLFDVISTAYKLSSVQYVSWRFETARPPICRCREGSQTLSAGPLAAGCPRVSSSHRHEWSRPCSRCSSTVRQHDV